MYEVLGRALHRGLLVGQEDINHTEAGGNPYIFMTNFDIGRQMRRSSTNLDVPCVAILLTTYNGAKYLEEQLQSIIRQTHTCWTLYVSDDGSTDDTLQIIESYRGLLGCERVRLLQGPRRGFAQNFLSLIRNPKVCGDYFSFCDQDDIWFPDKLERSLAQIPRIEQGPALYCSRTRLIDEKGREIGYSPLFDRPPAFCNALVQSLAGANTMLLNPVARALLAQVPLEAPVVSHDWLSYLLVSGCGGQVRYDPEPTLDYRQHGGNLIGSNSGFGDRLRRVQKMFAGTFRDWNRQNLLALRYCVNQFDTHNQTVLDQFESAREASLLQRLRLLRQAGVYRQTGFGNFGLLLAASIRRI